MSDAAIFTIGAVLFIATTWATIAFLLTRIQASYRTRLVEEEGVSVESDRFTERYVRPETD